MKKDLRKLGKINYANINLTDDVDIMMRSIITQNVRWQENRLISILKELFKKEEFERVQNLLRSSNKSVLATFLKDKGIEITMDNVRISGIQGNFTKIDIFVMYMRNTDFESMIDLSDSEEEFRKSLIDMKENYKRRIQGA